MSPNTNGLDANSDVLPNAKMILHTAPHNFTGRIVATPTNENGPIGVSYVPNVTGDLTTRAD